MADYNWSHMLLQVCTVVEIRPMQGLLVSFDFILVVILDHGKCTCRLISAKMPKEVWFL